MGESSAKHSLKKKGKRTEEPVVKPVDPTLFIDGVRKLEPTHIKGYVCLF